MVTVFHASRVASPDSEPHSHVQSLSAALDGLGLDATPPFARALYASLAHAPPQILAPATPATLVHRVEPAYLPPTAPMVTAMAHFNAIAMPDGRVASATHLFARLGASMGHAPLQISATATQDTVEHYATRLYVLLAVDKARAPHLVCVHARRDGRGPRARRPSPNQDVSMEIPAVYRSGASASVDGRAPIAIFLSAVLSAVMGLAYHQAYACVITLGGPAAHAPLV